MNFNYPPLPFPPPPPIPPMNWTVNHRPGFNSRGCPPPPPPPPPPPHHHHHRPPLHHHHPLPPPPPCPPPPHFNADPYFANFVPMPVVVHRPANAAPPPRQQCLGQHPSDKDWMDRWAAGLKTTKKETTRNNNNGRLKVSIIKKKLRNISVELKELERLSKCWSVLKKSLSEEEWLERKKETQAKKENLKRLFEELTESAVSNAESLLKKRRKKRLAEKVKREERRRQVQEAKLHREYEHKRIDLWLEKMKEEVERTRREESIKSEADLVLSEVTQKKTEARRTISLLSTLNKLRIARVQNLQTRGEYVSQQEILNFNEVIEKLKKYWVDQLKGYNLEEQGLRVMLNDAEVERSDVELSLRKRILKDWNCVLFGDKNSTDNLEPQTLEEFIALRYSWDKYVCADYNSLLASSIPSGWVIPSEPSDENWATLLKK